jgi:hypothetical protein
MSLDNIQLPPLVVADLFKNVLIDLKTTEQVIQNQSNTSLAYLGNNNKQICIVVNEEDAVYLKEDELSFLLGILAACKLSMADIALVNYTKNKPTYTVLKEEIKATIVLLFGVAPGTIDLPLAFPFYQLQKYNNQQYLYAPHLKELMSNKEEKTKLWNSLKIVFSLG